MAKKAIAVPNKQDIATPDAAQRRVVVTEPSKRFFVRMLTRDITLEDVILDLLDNCIDGILRTHQTHDAVHPYEGYWAEISFNENRFEIKDNCGGIPNALIERALKLGRPYELEGQETIDPANSIGVYGIGMKRAIFKMGGNALILTQSGEDRFQVEISTDWLQSETWDLGIDSAPNPFPSDGTDIVIESLDPEIGERFAAESFQRDILEQIRSHYAIILAKGFKVSVNGQFAKAMPQSFKFELSSQGRQVRPYIFQATVDDVQVFLAVGLRSAIPTEDETDAEKDQVNMSTKDAGWTVICNDRVVVSNNKDELTGWGTANIPNYHNQFRAIVGVVEFQGNASKLPTTTTKRGLEVSSALYQQVLERMREGLRLFIDYTNDWRSREDEAKRQVAPIQNLGFSDVKALAQTAELTFHQTKKGTLKGQQYKPPLPEPPTNSTTARISYFREREDVKSLAKAILPDYESIREKDVRKKVGEKTFDLAYEGAFGRKPGE